jgi:hypothetical protein
MLPHFWRGMRAMRGCGIMGCPRMMMGGGVGKGRRKEKERRTT